jgi:hypothetical protein
MSSGQLIKRILALCRPDSFSESKKIAVHDSGLGSCDPKAPHNVGFTSERRIRPRGISRAANHEHSVSRPKQKELSSRRPA